MSTHPQSRRWRRLGWGVLLVLTPVLSTAAFAALTLPAAAAQVYAPPAAPGPGPSAVSIDPAKPTAVIVLGPDGTNVADSLPPYEVLASTGRFNVLMVAATPGPAPLAGGIDVLPQTTFDELGRLVPGGPDVVIVPQLKGGPDQMKPLVQWLREAHASPRPPLMVSVCVGARHLAEAGILDGRPATSHWLGLIGLRRDFPKVQWRDDVTYVDDGDVITSAGVLLGINATLRVVERFTDQQTAATAARAINWDYYSPGQAAHITSPHLSPADATAFLSAAYRWDRPSTGVLVTGGIGETDLAAALRPYTELSYLDHSTSVTMDGQPVRTRHGLVLVPHGSVTAPERPLDRLLVPGHTSDEVKAMPLPQGLDVTALQPDRDAFAADGALLDIARTTDVSTARWVAKSMQYPTDGLALDGSPWPWGLTARAVAIALAPLFILIAARRLWARRRTKTVTVPPS